MGSDRSSSTHTNYMRATNLLNEFLTTKNLPPLKDSKEETLCKINLMQEFATFLANHGKREKHLNILLINIFVASQYKVDVAKQHLSGAKIAIQNKFNNPHVFEKNDMETASSIALTTRGQFGLSSWYHNLRQDLDKHIMRRCFREGMHVISS